MIYFLLFAIVASFIIIYALISTRATIHLYYIIPITLAAGVGLYMFFDTVLGYPTKHLGIDKFQLISYTTNEEQIFVWVVLQGEEIPKAYSMPYSEEQHAELESAMDKMSTGQFVEGEFGDLSDKEGQYSLGSNKSSGAEFRLYEVDPQQFLPGKRDGTHIPNNYPETFHTLPD